MRDQIRELLHLVVAAEYDNNKTAQQVHRNLGKKMDFLLDNKEFIKAQQLNIRCKLNRKAKELFGTELQILRAKDYYTA
jgi:hypothetical protein